MVPKMSANLAEVWLMSDEVKKLVMTMRAKVRELAALTVDGSCEPPAPNDAVAAHRPGARKEHPPSTVMLKKVDRYQVGLLPSHTGRASGLGSRRPMISRKVEVALPLRGCDGVIGACSELLLGNLLSGLLEVSSTTVVGSFVSDMANVGTRVGERDT